MSAAPTPPPAPRASRPGPLPWCGRNRHFLLAAGVLSAAAAWWLLAPNYLRWALRKSAVPWPEGVDVTADFRWRNLPETLGPYVLLGDGRLSEQRDGLSDGEIVFNEELRHTLGVGTSFDETRLADRRSNWYVARLYEDARPADRTGPLRWWRLDVTYYTGDLDTVPHIPEKCLVASGADVLDTTPLRFEVPAARGPWDRPFTVLRTRYQTFDKSTLSVKQFVQYYVFCLNGVPESSWKKVRLLLTYPWVRHCYFAKIQFAPRHQVADLDDADRRAEEFANAFLPAVLKALPEPADIEALDSGAPRADPTP